MKRIGQICQEARIQGLNRGALNLWIGQTLTPAPTTRPRLFNAIPLSKESYTQETFPNSHAGRARGSKSRLEAGGVPDLPRTLSAERGGSGDGL